MLAMIASRALTSGQVLVTRVEYTLALVLTWVRITAILKLVTKQERAARVDAERAH